MKTLVIGSHGQIGQILIQKLANENDEVLAAVRDTSQIAAASKITPIAFNLEDPFETLAKSMVGIDAVVFAAGSGGSTGADKTLLIDLDGAVKSMKAAELAGVKRFVLVSALYAENPEKWSDGMRPYYVAKYYADEWIKNDTELNYTIIRPGALTNDEGTGKVAVSIGEGDAGKIARTDVASVIVETLHNSRSSQIVFNVIEGSQSIHDAINEL